MSENSGGNHEEHNAQSLREAPAAAAADSRGSNAATSGVSTRFEHIEDPRSASSSVRPDPEQSAPTSGRSDPSEQIRTTETTMAQAETIEVEGDEEVTVATEGEAQDATSGSDIFTRFARNPNHPTHTWASDSEAEEGEIMPMPRGYYPDPPDGSSQQMTDSPPPQMDDTTSAPAETSVQSAPSAPSLPHDTAATPQHSPEYVAWRDAGRPRCANCQRLHPPPCKEHLARWARRMDNFRRQDPRGHKAYVRFNYRERRRHRERVEAQQAQQAEQQLATMQTATVGQQSLVNSGSQSPQYSIGFDPAGRLTQLSPNYAVDLLVLHAAIRDASPERLLELQARPCIQRRPDLLAEVIRVRAERLAARTSGHITQPISINAAALGPFNAESAASQTAFDHSDAQSEITPPGLPGPAISEQNDLAMSSGRGPSDTSAQNIDTDAQRPINTEAGTATASPDHATVQRNTTAQQGPDNSSRGPTENFRTGSERALARQLDDGEPSDKVWGKQPKR